MAPAGVMADFARLPPQQKVMVFVVIGVLLGALYWQFVWKPLKANLANAERENKAKAALNKKLADDIPKYEELKASMKSSSEMIEENQKALPTEAEVPAFFETLERKVTRVRRRDPQVEEAQGGAGRDVRQACRSRSRSSARSCRSSGSSRRSCRSQRHAGRDRRPGRGARAHRLDREPRAHQPDGPQPRDRADREVHRGHVPPGGQGRRGRDADQERDAAARGAAARADAAGRDAPAAGRGDAGRRQGAQTEQALEKGDAINRDATGVDEAKTPGDGSARLKGGI